MKNLYMLKNIRTGVIEYDNLYAQDVHDLIGINKSCISKYEKSKSVYNGTWRIMMSSGTELWTEYTRDAWDTYRKLVLRGMARAARKGWRSYAEMICHGAIQPQEAEDNGKEHHTGEDRSG